MSKLILIMDRINKYLLEKNLTLIQGEPDNLEDLYELALRSVWKVSDPAARDNYAVDIGTILKPYFGGPKVAQALETLKVKLDNLATAEKEQADRQELKEKLKDPNYVPTFDELMQGNAEND